MILLVTRVGYTITSDGAYHCNCNCQHPPHKNVSRGPNLCPKHTSCHCCAFTAPGNGIFSWMQSKMNGKQVMKKGNAANSKHESLLPETLRVKDEEMQHFATDIRVRDSTIKKTAEKLIETAEPAESVASAAHTMDEQW